MRRRVVCPRSHPASLYVRGLLPAAAGSQCCPRGDPRTPCRSMSAACCPLQRARSAVPGGDPRTPMSLDVRGLLPAPAGSQYSPGPRAATGTLLFVGVGGTSLAVIVGRPDAVQGLACLGQHLPRLTGLRFGADANDLERGPSHLANQLAHLDGGTTGTARDYVPRGPQLIRVLGRIRPAILGQLVGPAAAIARLRSDRALILKLL